MLLAQDQINGKLLVCIPEYLDGYYLMDSIWWNLKAPGPLGEGRRWGNFTKVKLILVTLLRTFVHSWVNPLASYLPLLSWTVKKRCLLHNSPHHIVLLISCLHLFFSLSAILGLTWSLPQALLSGCLWLGGPLESLVIYVNQTYSGLPV